MLQNDNPKSSNHKNSNNNKITNIPNNQSSQIYNIGHKNVNIATQNQFNKYHHYSSNSTLRKKQTYNNNNNNPNNHQRNNSKHSPSNSLSNKNKNQNQTLTNFRKGLPCAIQDSTFLNKDLKDQKDCHQINQYMNLNQPNLNILRKKVSQNTLLNVNLNNDPKNISNNLQKIDFRKFSNQNLANNKINNIDNRVSHAKQQRATFKSSQNYQQQLNKKSKSTGKLRLGKQAKPAIILTRQQRLDPFYQKTNVNQQMINKKGILELLSMGVLSKNSDFGQILNNKYQVIPQLQIQKKNQVNRKSQQIQQMLDSFFPTNPLTNQTLLNNINEESIPKFQQQNNDKQKQFKQKKSGTRKSKSRKVKHVKQQKPKFQIPQQKFTLTILNHSIQLNQIYKEYMKKIRLQGNQTQFKIFLDKMVLLTQKYKFKRIHFDPSKIDFISNVRKMTDKMLVSCIDNYKVLGLGILIKGTKQQIRQSYAKTFLARYKYKKSLGHLLKIQQLKRYFRIRKFYTQMTIKRQKFLKMKLSAFAQNQRRYIQDYRQSIVSFVQSETSNFLVKYRRNIENFDRKKKFCPQVQIHILSVNFSPQQQKTHYKLTQKLRAQLTRLYSSQAQDIIILVDDQDDYEEYDQTLLTNNKKQSLINYVQKVKTLKSIKIIPQVKTIEQILLEDQQKFIPIKKPFYESILQNFRQTPAKIHIIKLGLKHYKIKLNNKKNFQSPLNILNIQRKKQNQTIKINPTYNVQQTGSIYYGLNQVIINQIKQICKRKTVAIVPYLSSINIAKIADFLGVNCYGGNLTPASILSLQEENQQNNEDQNKLVKISGGLNQKYQMKKKKILKNIKMANQFYESKVNIKSMFKKLKIPTPNFIDSNEKNQNGTNRFSNQLDFIQALAKQIFSHKQVNKWVFKLPNEKFSRGLAFLQTDSLKILKQKKKKGYISKQDLQQIKIILKSILHEKIQIPHTSLIDRKQFLQKFFINFNNQDTQNNQIGGYVQQMIQTDSDSNNILLNNKIDSCSVFGKIQLDGKFYFMGTYKKIYTQNNIACSAFYPAQILNKPLSINQQIPLKKIIMDINTITQYLYQSENVFGYITFELLFNCRTEEYFFIDIQPNLDQYSSFYFFYTNKFKMENHFYHFQTKQLKIVTEKQNKQLSKDIESQETQINQSIIEANSLPKNILYCPFIDNNGNKLQSYYEFEQELLQKKNIYTHFNYQKQSYNENATKFDLGSDNTIGTRKNMSNSIIKSKKANININPDININININNENDDQGYQFFYLTPNKPDSFGVACFGNQQKSSIKMFLEVLTFIINIGGKFNKFDKRYGQNLRKKQMIQNKIRQSLAATNPNLNTNNKDKNQINRYSTTSLTNMRLDGVYIMDILWMFRQMKRRQKTQHQKKTIIMMSGVRKQKQEKSKQTNYNLKQKISKARDLKDL